MRTMVKHLAIAMGFALVLGMCGAPATGHGGTAVSSAIEPIALLSTGQPAPARRAPDCPICDSHCCNS